MNIDAETDLYILLGNPVSHSLGPAMHNRALAYLQHNGVYLAFCVENIEGAIKGIRALGIRGASVTIPHKISVMPFLDKLDPKAERIGAVNTIVNRDGCLVGYNSDATGAVRALLEKTSLKDKAVAIIGAGGAARAIGYGVVSEGAKTVILNRTPERGEPLANELGADFFPLNEIGKVPAEILVNTTPVGMFPDTDATPVDKGLLHDGMVVMDIVYNPFATRFLREAAEKGCITIDGVGMFVYQGAFQLELWTGKAAPITIMRQAVVNALTKEK